MTLRRKESLAGFVLALPFLLGFFLFYLIPFCVSIVYTFTFAGSFAGFSNYVSIFQSAAFQLAAGNTGRFILIGIPLIMAISLFLSLLLYRRFHGSGFFRSVFLFPLILPIASTVMVYQVFLAESGIVNSILTGMNLPAQDWLNSDAAFPVLIFLYIWKNCGYNIILFLAGLNAIPAEYYSAAELEGASRPQAFLRITAPLLMPHFFFVFVISIMNSFKAFREAYLLGGDHPDNSIYLLQHFMNNNFANLNYQRLSVAALLVFLVIFVLVLLLFSLKQRVGDYEL